MSFHFSCPFCARNNYRHAALPTGNSYFTLQCARCNRTPVYWVASQAAADLLITNEITADARSIAIGGVKTELSHWEPGIAIGGREEVAELVARTTKATLFDKYSQGERIATYSAESADVREGICEGQCLHWIRRVLQGGRDSYEVPAIKNDKQRAPDAIAAKQRLQHVGGATVQRQNTPERAAAIHDTNREDYDKKLQAQLAKGGITLTITKRADGGTSTNYSYPNTPANREIVEKAKAIRKRYLESEIEGPNWNSLATVLDAALERAGAGKKRTFAGILCRKVKNQEAFSGVAAFAETVVKDADFKIGSCALLSVGLFRGIGEGGGAISGHATAIHYVRAHQLFVFDPNVGVFSCTTIDDVKKALVALIGEGWTKIMGWQLNRQFGYSLFEARAAPAAVSPARAASVAPAAASSPAVHAAPPTLPTTAGASEKLLVAAPTPGGMTLANKNLLPAKLKPSTPAPARGPAPIKPVNPAAAKPSAQGPVPSPSSGANTSGGKSVSDLRKMFDRK